MFIGTACQYNVMFRRSSLEVPFRKVKDEFEPRYKDLNKRKRSNSDFEEKENDDMNHNINMKDKNSVGRRRGSVHVVDRRRLEHMFKHQGSPPKRVDESSSQCKQGLLNSQTKERGVIWEDLVQNNRICMMGEKKRMVGAMDIEIQISEH